MLKIIDDHEFEEISENCYKALTPYLVNIREWLLDVKHTDYEAVVLHRANWTADILYVATGTGVAELAHIYKELHDNNELIGQLACAQSGPEEIGGLEDCGFNI